MRLRCLSALLLVASSQGFDVAGETSWLGFALNASADASTQDVRCAKTRPLWPHTFGLRRHQEVPAVGRKVVRFRDALVTSTGCVFQPKGNVCAKNGGCWTQMGCGRRPIVNALVRRKFVVSIAMNQAWAFWHFARRGAETRASSWLPRHHASHDGPSSRRASSPS